MGRVPLPTKKRIYCVLKSFMFTKTRDSILISGHQLINILHPTAQIIDFLMQLDMLAGVDVEVKL
ncbi:Ribosomal protein S10 [Artemisia annua]|uniref:Ribosomal protein S10 n=1 Tax=Artemisia annua TaxID=35608 RepID=A0A2U1PQ00_ARTAN|nr:Ribosomal protein S10 [Artemisia annua]